MSDLYKRDLWMKDAWSRRQHDEWFGKSDIQALVKEVEQIVAQAIQGQNDKRIRQGIETLKQKAKTEHNGGRRDIYWKAIKWLEAEMSLIAKHNELEAQVSKSGLQDISTVLDNHFFWIAKGYGIDGIEWAPTLGHHDDIAFQAFGQKNAQGNDNHKVDWSHVAMTKGWVRGIYNNRRELNLEWVRGAATPKSKQIMLKMIKFLRDQASQFVFEIHDPNGTDSINQIVPDARSAAALVRQY